VFCVALAQQEQRVVTQVFLVSGITEQFGPIAGQMVALIESTQEQQPSIAGDLSAGKIGANGLVAVEGEARPWSTSCHLADAPDPVFMHLLEHPFFLCQQNQ
jgi:hypothetical protein